MTKNICERLMLVTILLWAGFFLLGFVLLLREQFMAAVCSGIAGALMFGASLPLFVKSFGYKKGGV